MRRVQEIYEAETDQCLIFKADDPFLSDSYASLFRKDNTPFKDEFIPGHKKFI